MTKKKRSVFFPYKSVRSEQDALLSSVLNAVEEKKHLIAHAPTGLGKTAAVLSPAISYALEEQKTVFFLTPKISQHEIAVQLIRDLNKRFSLEVTGIDLVGRKYMCPNRFLQSAENSEFYELCRRMRKKEACSFFANAFGFTSSQRLKAKHYMEKMEGDYQGIWDHLELKEYCECFQGSQQSGLCSYEAALKLSRKANVIVADYFHLLSPSVGKIILKKAGKKLNQSIIVLDEAHNLPERLRALLSATLSVSMIKKAEKEVKKINADASELMLLRQCLKQLAVKKSLASGEALVLQGEFESLAKGIEFEELSAKLQENAADYLEAAGTGRSALLGVAGFLEKWKQQDESFIRIIKIDERNVKLQLKAMDPSIISSQVFRNTHSTVLMSGTLLPTKMYADLLGLEENRTVLKEFNSPFPQQNKLSLIVPSVTTKYSERSADEFKRIADLVLKITNSIPGNTAVFFPSFALASSIKYFIEGKTNKPVLVQRERMDSAERFALLSEFRKKAKTGAVLLAPASGSFAEGIDYIGKQLLCAVIVGIPLREMDLEQECLIEYYQGKFGAGWHYAYIFPAITRAIQAAGRVIRDRNDRGVVAFLDKRYLWQNYAKCIPKDLAKIVTEEPEKYINEFWNDK